MEETPWPPSPKAVPLSAAGLEPALAVVDPEVIGHGVVGDVDVDVAVEVDVTATAPMPRPVGSQRPASP
jgi:hypothetical protein